MIAPPKPPEFSTGVATIVFSLKFIIWLLCLLLPTSVFVAYIMLGLRWLDPLMPSLFRGYLSVGFAVITMSWIGRK